MSPDTEDGTYQCLENSRSYILAAESVCLGVVGTTTRNAEQ